MIKMKDLPLLSAVALVTVSLAAGACDSDDPDPGDAQMVPTLGTQLERMGRPAINTATNNTFADDDTRGAAEDAWNAEGDPAAFAESFAADTIAGIAVLDSLDGTCGNQVGYDFDPGVGTVNYQAIGTVLANDWLIVKGDAAGGCNIYLGVEASVLGVANDDCGGRTPAYDVVETSYSALAGVGLSGFDDGITAPAAATVDSFPYLAAPN